MNDIFRIPGKTWWVCHAQEHGWGCQIGDGMLWFSEQANFMPLLPLLEMPWQAADDLVRRATEKHTRMTAFPFDATVLTALAWPTPYWPTVAVSWLEQKFSPPAKALEHLGTLSHNKAMPQHLRHRCLALIRHNKNALMQKRNRPIRDRCAQRWR